MRSIFELAIILLSVAPSVWIAYVSERNGRGQEKVRKAIEQDWQLEDD